MSEVGIDTEFRSGTDIGLGLPRYFADPEAAVLCVAYTLEPGRVDLWKPGDAAPLALLDHVCAGGKVRGWNVMFEWYVWRFLMLKHGWPALRIEQCVDSMAEAAAMNLPQGLDNCGKALDMAPEFQKSKRGKELIKLLCIPQQEPVVQERAHYSTEGAYKGALTRHAHWIEKGGRWRNDPALLEELYAYCVQDVVAEQAIVKRIRRLPEYEQRVWVKTQEINLRGVPIDCGEIAGIVRVVDQEMDRLNGELATLTGGEVSAASEVEKLRTWCNARLEGEDRLVDMTAETVERWLLEAAVDSYEGVSTVRHALSIRAAIGQTSTAKLPKMLEVVAEDATLKNMLVYHGASTGRDASRSGVNLQNLKSPKLADCESAVTVLATGDHELARLVYGDEVMDAAVSVVRSVIKAPRGYEFTDGDYSSIENRVSAYIAGQDDKLDLFRSGLDEYKTFAQTLFGVPYDAVTPAQRKFSKPPILGGMFGQGAQGLVDYAAKMGVTITLARAKELTAAYRKAYAKVQACWYACGDAAMRACESPGEWHHVNPRIKLRVQGEFLYMKLPSGRLLAWFAPEVHDRKTPWGEVRATVTVMQVDTFTHQWRRDKLIGSSIFQSAVQATARDVLMHGMFNLEDAGYRVVLRIHDELLSCNPVGFGSVEDYIARMCINPPWCPDLPLAGEGWRAKRFRK